MALGGKRLAAPLKLAHIGLQPCVNSHVGLQVAVLGEPLVANGAFEWLFICMSPNMDFEAATSLILFPTILANMGFFAGMDQDVGR